jgi:Stress up-regulated Nod 19
MKRVLRRTGPRAGRSPRDVLLVALAVGVAMAVIALSAADAFLHPGSQATAARVTPAGPGVPAEVHAGLGAPAVDTRMLAPSGSAPAPASARLVAPHTKTAARQAEAMPMAMPGGSLPEPAMPTPNVTTVKDGPLPVLPSLLGQPSELAGGVPLVAGLPVLTSPCSNCYVTGIQVDMVFADGRSANLDSGIMLHHLVLIQPGLPDTTCPASTLLGALGQRFFASGNERTPGVLPPGFGYHLGSGPLLAVFDIMNMSSSLQVVWLSATVSWLPDTTPGIKAVTPVWLDENNCSSSVYAIPAGPSNRVWTWTSTITGRVVTAGGHVHDGGVETVLTNQTTGQHICTSQAGYTTMAASMGSVDSMTTCSHDRLGTVRAGDVLALDTSYNSPVPKTDVMGIMIAYVYETSDLAGGTEDPAATGPAPSMPPPGGMAGMGGMG